MGINGFPVQGNTGEEGGGFVFGGEFDAEPTVTPNTAEFNHLIDCAISAGTLVPSASQFGATASNLSKVDVGTQMEFRVVWPDTTAGFFMFLMHNSSEINPYLASNDATATVYGIGASMRTPVVLIREGETYTQDPLGVAITAGDVIRIGYRPAIATVYFYNETQGNSFIAEHAVSAFGSGATIPVNLGVFAMSAVPLAFDFADDYPLQQNTYSFTLPSEPDGKTYLVANATLDSIFDSKLLKNNDFVTFYDGASKAIVTRLYTDKEIDAVAQAAITQELEVGGSIYNAIQSAVNS